MRLVGSGWLGKLGGGNFSPEIEGFKYTEVGGA